LQNQKNREFFQLNLDFVLCHVLEIKFVEMGESAVPATNSKMTAAYRYIMGTSHMTVPAFRGFKKVPDIVTTDLCECSGLSDIFNAGNKNTGRTAVGTCNLRLVRYRFYNLVCHLPAMVAVRAEFRKNEPVAHGKYWMRPGSLICCTIFPCQNIRSNSIAQRVAFYSAPVASDTSSDGIRAIIPSTGYKILEIRLYFSIFNIERFFWSARSKIIESREVNLITG